MIENLGATQDEYEAIDLSDNQIGSFENFPLLKRLITIFLNNNAVASIAALGKNLPRLEDLMMCNNELSSLGELKNLGDLPRLRTLGLIGNAVTEHEHYRLYLIYKCKRLEVLDFRKVKQSERKAAEGLFGGDKGATLLTKIEGTETDVGTVKSSNAVTLKRQRLNEAEREQERKLKARIVEAIQRAKTLEDVAKLRKALEEQTPEKVIPLLEQIEATFDQEEGGNGKKKQKVDE